MKKSLWNKKKGKMAIILVGSMLFSQTSPAWADAFYADCILAQSSENIENNSNKATDSDADVDMDTNADSDANLDSDANTDLDVNADSISEATMSEATPSVALFALGGASSIGDIWDDWIGDFTFLNGKTGNGSKQKPYQIKNKSQLMGLSQLAAMGMRVQEGEGNSEIIGSYDGSYFELTTSIDLGGMEWRPIGFYGDSSELSGDVTNKFFGHFNGNGKTVSNFRFPAQSGTMWSNVGFFGAIEDATVENLVLKPGKTIYGKTNTAILVGSVVNSKIFNCTVTGKVAASGTTGGIAGDVSGFGTAGSGKTASVIENCEANVILEAETGAEIYVGGMTGKASNTTIVDCKVTTGDNAGTRIQGKGVVGGITGFQNGSDIYNCFVSGTVGGTGTKVAGGITGQYGAGDMKAVRFEGIMGLSDIGSAGRRGTFIGGREAGNYFRYGEDVAYLFTDTESGIAFNICGSEIPDDNEYTYAAHIGYSHSDDLHYSLAQGGKYKDSTDTYFYEELEQGILTIMDEDNGGADAATLGYEIDHIAPNDAGRPTRGYLITIPQIDTVSSGTNYYDIAVLEARGNSGYYKTASKDHRGAAAPGKTVTVSTSPNNTEHAKFQMVGVPTYTKGSIERNTTYQNGGEYTFTMPAENTEIKAVYKKVAVKVSVIPSAYPITVIEERNGNRKNPVKTTKVLNREGKLIATYINGNLQQGTQIQPISIGAVVDSNNDVADSSIKWSVDDPELIVLAANDDEDAEGYTNKSGSIAVNLQASFFTDTIRELEKIQAGQNYQYPIPDTIYGAGHQNGGVAILTAATRPAASFEGKPCTGNSKIGVTFQIKDKTYVANEGASLDKATLDFTVTRKLMGDRRNPEVQIQVTPPQTLSASFRPDFFDRKDIAWTIDDGELIQVNGMNKAAVVSAVQDAKWIKDILASDAGIHANHPNEVLKGSGSRMAKVTVIADDMLGNRQTADCTVTIRLITDDQTVVGGLSSGYGGGGSSGGGGGGSSKGISTAGGGPSGSVVGTWINTVDGRWTFTSGGRIYSNEWAYIHNPYAGKNQPGADWFRMDKTGHMVTGWFTDTDGNQYYLHPVSDGTMGHMVIGCQSIIAADGTLKQYYFNPVSNGTKGALLRNTVTPDGKSVDENGVVYD
ncbi:MAG: peptidase A26 [Clostridium sp.]